jgi:SAM-dependent methyltransferase
VTSVKHYDRAYFDRWYRAPGAVVRPDVVRRKVRLAVAAAEYMLDREIRTVLDVGCGEAPWRAILRRMRPQVAYAGVDPSAYVVSRYGRTRNIRRAGMGELDALRLRKSYDLVVCADMLEYVPRPDMARGLATIARVLGGVAYIEAFTTADELVGDREGWHHRTPATYQRAFRAAGLFSCGMNCYVNESGLTRMNALELADPTDLPTSGSAT